MTGDETRGLLGEFQKSLLSRPGMSSKKPNKDQLAFRRSLEEAIGKHPDMSSLEMLVILSHFVGQIIALQDYRKYSSEQIMDLVAQNVETGNQEVVQAHKEGRL